MNRRVRVALRHLRIQALDRRQGRIVRRWLATHSSHHCLGQFSRPHHAIDAGLCRRRCRLRYARRRASVSADLNGAHPRSQSADDIHHTELRLLELVRTRIRRLMKIHQTIQPDPNIIISTYSCARRFTSAGRTSTTNHSRVVVRASDNLADHFGGRLGLDRLTASTTPCTLKLGTNTPQSTSPRSLESRTRRRPSFGKRRDTAFSREERLRNANGLRRRHTRFLPQPEAIIAVEP